MFAQITNQAGMIGGLPDPGSPAAIGWVVLILAGLVTIVRQGIGLWKDLTHKKGTMEVLPNPLNVQTVHDLVKEKDCHARHKTIEDQVSELRAQRIQDAKDGALSRKAIYDKIDLVRKELGQEINAMPAQIVAQLLNAKHLFRDE